VGMSGIGRRLGCASSLFAAASRRDAIRAIAAAGYEAVDLWASPRLCEHVDVRADDPQVVLAEVAEHGLRVNALTLYARDHDHLRAGLEWAGAAGVERVVFHPFGDDFLDFVVPYVARAAELGVEVALENHIDCPIDSIASARWWLDRIGASNVGLALASPHAVAIGEGFERTLAALADHVRLLYVWDVPKACTGVAWLREHWWDHALEQLPGYGSVDFAEVARIAPDVEASVSVHGCERWPLERTRSELVRARLYLATQGWQVPLADDEREELGLPEA
jgi:sugar phosphate isomerase/epimerase